MAKRSFIAGDTNKAEAIREALNSLGIAAPNADVKQWIADNWEGFSWGTNPAAEIIVARKSLHKANGTEMPTRKKKRGRKIKQAGAVVRPRVAKQPAAVSTRSALVIAIELLEQSGDAEGVLAKARQVVAATGSVAKALEIVSIL